MKVRILLNLGTTEFPDTPFAQGSVHEVDEQLGKKLVARTLAVPVEDEPEPVAEAMSPRDVAEEKAVTKSAARAGK